jgi:hypothetical protein
MAARRIRRTSACTIPRGERGIERLGADCSVVRRPPPLIEQQQGPQPPDVSIDQPAPVVELGGEHGIAAQVRRQRPLVHLERASHAGLDHQPPGAKLEDGVLGTTHDAADGRTAEATQQPAPGGSAYNVIMTERYRAEGAPHEARTELPDDRFDFGQFGHEAPESYARP